MSGPIQMMAGAVLTAAGFIIPGAQPLIGIGLSMTAAGLGSMIAGGGVGKRQRGLMQNVTSTEAPIPVVYGRAKVGIVIADIEPYGTNNNMLALVGALVLGSENGQGIEAVEQILFDEREAIDAPPFGGEPRHDGLQSAWITDHPHVNYGLHSGADTQVVDAECYSKLADWTAQMVGLGVAYIALFLEYGEKAFPGGIPNVTAILKGQKVYDPRTSSWAWSDNPALCALDYLTSKRYGLGALYAARDGGSRDEIDEASFIAAANYCDETVAIPGGAQARFTCNGAVDTGRTLQANLQDILSSCRGKLVYSGGRFSLQINQVAVPTTFELTEDNIVGDWDFVRAGTDGAPNRVTCSYVDATANWQANSVTWPEPGDANGFLDDDAGFENILSFDLPLTVDHYMGQQIGMVGLREARNDLAVAVTATEAALELSVGQVVPLTHSTPGWVKKLFRVETIGMTQDALVRLELSEYTDEAYSLSAQNTRDTLPDTTLPDPFSIAAPTGVGVTSSSATALATQDGKVVPRLLLALTPSADPYLKRTNVQFKLHAASAWNSLPSMGPADTTLYIAPVTDGASYDVQVQAENTVGVTSDWVAVTGITAATLHVESTFYAPSTAPPTAGAVGDLWIVTDKGNELRRWNGTSWVTVSPGAAVIAAGNPTPTVSIDSTSASLSGEIFTVSAAAGAGSPSPTLQVRYRTRVSQNPWGAWSSWYAAPKTGVSVARDLFYITELQAQAQDTGVAGNPASALVGVTVQPKLAGLDSSTGAVDPTVSPKGWSRTLNDTDDGAVRAQSAVSSDGTAIKQGVSISDGVNNLSAQKGRESSTAADGAGVTFGIIRQSAPLVTYSSGGLTYSNGLTQPLWQKFAASGLSASGFTPVLRLSEVAGALTARSIASWTIPGSLYSAQASKTLAAEAYDDRYTLNYKLSFGHTGNSDWEEVGYYYNTGSGWVQETTETFYSTGAAFSEDESHTMTVSGMGASSSFAVNKEAGSSAATIGAAATHAVTWEEGSAPTDTPATPSGVSDVLWRADG